MRGMSSGWRLHVGAVSGPCDMCLGKLFCRGGAKVDAAFRHLLCEMVLAWMEAFPCTCKLAILN